MLKTTLRLLLAVALIAPVSVLAEPTEKSVYSKPAPPLRLVKRSDGGENGHGAEFHGIMALTGKLIIEFDRAPPDVKEPEYHDAEGQAFFEPDSASKSRLPAAVGSFYPRPVDIIWLDKRPRDLLPRLVNPSRTREVLQGRLSRYEFKVELTISSFAAWVECDHRSYTATVHAIRIRRPEMIAMAEAKHLGC